MPNFRELLAQAKAAISETTAEDLQARMEAGERIQTLDVREQDETQNGVLPGAKILSRAHFESRVEDVVPDKHSEVIVYCASGVRSAFAAQTMQELGYTNVKHLKGGFIRWKDLGYRFDVPHVLDASQRDRY